MYLNLLAATALAFWIINGLTSVAAQPMTSAGWDEVKRLVQAAYFSEACEQEAATLGMRTSDANAIFAAVSALARSHTDRPDADPSDVQRIECREPLVLLLNLLRLNGIAGELAFVSTPVTSLDNGQPNTIDRVLVYLAALDRYVDPAMPPASQVELDRTVRERTDRILLPGPSIGALGRDACHDLCLRIVGAARRDGHVRRVTSEVVRAR